MAKLARAGGGYTATTTDPHMIGQIQVINVTNLYEAKLKLYEHKAELLAEADTIDPILKKFGGGARDLEVRIIEDSPIGGFLVVSEIGYPGWRASANDETLEIHRANGIFQMVELGPGYQEVRFSYLPRSFQIGRIMTLGSLALVVGMLFHARRRKSTA